MGEWIAAAGAAIYGALSSAAAAGGTAAAGTGAASAAGAAAGGAAAAGAAAGTGSMVGGSMLGGLTAASATTAATAGAGMVGTGGMTAAGLGAGAGLGAVAGEVAKAAVGGALSAGASMLTPKPNMPSAPPPVTPNTYGKESLPKKIAEPSGPPTEGVASSNAFKAEERRRLLAGMPQATQNIFSSPGGDQGVARLRKPRLLGGGVGQTTTGV